MTCREVVQFRCVRVRVPAKRLQYHFWNPGKVNHKIARKLAKFLAEAEIAQRQLEHAVSVAGLILSRNGFMKK
jgi:hypothetical protein